MPRATDRDLVVVDAAALRKSLRGADAFADALEAELAGAVRGLQAEAPRDSGTLARSFSSGVRRTADGAEGELVNSAPHAGFLRRRNAERPYIDEVEDAAGDAATRAVARWLEVTLNGPGETP